MGVVGHGGGVAAASKKPLAPSAGGQAVGGQAVGGQSNMGGERSAAGEMEREDEATSRQGGDYSAEELDSSEGETSQGSDMMSGIADDVHVDQLWT